VPDRLQIPVDSIIDEHEHLKGAVILGWTHSGDRLISYTSSPVPAADGQEGDYLQVPHGACCVVSMSMRVTGRLNTEPSCACSCGPFTRTSVLCGCATFPCFASMRAQVSIDVLYTSTSCMWPDEASHRGVTAAAPSLWPAWMQ
jgi:hypothetical protein